jgi:bacteriocin-like protein
MSLAWMEKIMSTVNDTDLMETTMSQNKDTEKTRELTEAELEHVSGGKYLEFKLKEVLISGVTPSAGANVPPSL